MKKAIFAVHTEYHLMFALKMISVIPEFKECTNIVLRISPIGTSRFKESYDFEGTGIEYRVLLYNYGYFKEKGFKKALNEQVLNEKPDYYVLFYELQPWYTYLLPKLRKNGTRIILAPDGINLYNSGINWKRRWDYFIYGNILLYTNGFFNFMKFPSNRWGYRKEIDDIAIENKDALGFNTNKNIIEVKTNDATTLKRIKDLTNKCFGVVVDKSIVIPHSFLWIDQPMSPEEEEWELVILKEIKKRHPDRAFFIKPHPRSNKETVIALQRELDAKIVHTPYPAELLFDNLTDTIVVSICSTAMLHYSPGCKYFWIYPLFKDNAGFNPTKLPFDHIKEVNDVKELDAI